MYKFKKQFIDEENYKIGYYVNDKFQKFVDENKPMYVEWINNGNICEEIPYVTPEPEPEIELDVLKSEIYSRIDFKTQIIIDEGITIKEVLVKLTLERQKEIQALFSMRDDLTYPFLIWEDMEDISITDADEMKVIAKDILEYIYAKKYEAKQMKTIVKNYNRIQCQNWSDNR